MNDTLKSRRVLMFVDDVYEDLELWYPKLRLHEAGSLVTVAGPKAGGMYRANMAIRAVPTRRSARCSPASLTAW